MQKRVILLGAGLAATAAVLAAAAAVHARRARVAPATPPDATPGGWATCSAPSARVYDLVFGWLLAGLYRRMADDLAAALADGGGADVLEVGPGPGGLAVELARRVPVLRLTGIDVDPAMIDRAQARARREGLDARIRFEVGDVRALPFADASFDLVTSSFSAHHWPAAATGFAEIRRILRPGGRAIVYDLPDAWGRHETKAPPLAEAAAAGGFTAARVTTLAWPGSVALVRRLEATRPDA